MNKYGALAMTMVRDHDPQRWEEMDRESRESYFSNLGEQIQERISDLTPELQGQDVPGESYLEKVGRINNASLRAEEIVLTEMVYSQLPIEEDETDLPVAGTTTAVNELNAVMTQLREE